MHELIQKKDLYLKESARRLLAHVQKINVADSVSTSYSNTHTLNFAKVYRVLRLKYMKGQRRNLHSAADHVEFQQPVMERSHPDF